ncbi:MAG: hypothetical protein GY937_01700 [bacterium]|nr:hypothetical protein [bacterium]
MYDRSEAVHYRDQQRQKDEFVGQLESEAADRFSADTAFPWDYNRIFGWVGLYAGKGQVKGELFRRGHLHAALAFPETSPTRRRLLRRKQLFHWDKVLELYFAPSDASETIQAQLSEALGRLPREVHALRRREVRLDVLENVGPFIDWRRLVRLDP